MFACDSKSRLKPSIIALPNGRGWLNIDLVGPKVFQSVFAAAIAALEEEKPPPEYVAPPKVRRIVLP